MPKKAVYTQITPIPSHVPRQLALDMLHSHGEIIELNPLVLEHHPIKAPQNASADEFFSVWHEITERIQYIPGMGRMGSGKISFKGVFHDMPWGLQTHIYAPAGVDLRNKWQIRGNQRGEPPEPRELGSGAPAEGLYLREDVEIKCNFAMLSFVKKEMKVASATMVSRLVRKAELLDAGILHAMFEGGKLKSVNPAVRDSLLAAASRPNAQQFPQSPGFQSNSPRFPPPVSPGLPPQSPALSPPGRSSPQINPDATPSVTRSDSQVAPYHVLRQQEEDRRRQTMYGSDQYNQYNQQAYGQNTQQTAYNRQSSGLNEYNHQSSGDRQGLAIELAGDNFYPQQMASSSFASHLHPGNGTNNNNNRQSTYSELSNHSPQQNSFGQSSATTPNIGSDRLSMSRADSMSSHPSSYHGGGGSAIGAQSPRMMDQKMYTNDIPSRQ